MLVVQLTRGRQINRSAPEMKGSRELKQLQLTTWFKNQRGGKDALLKKEYPWLFPDLNGGYSDGNGNRSTAPKPTEPPSQNQDCMLDRTSQKPEEQDQVKTDHKSMIPDCKSQENAQTPQGERYEKN